MKISAILSTMILASILLPGCTAYYVISPDQLAHQMKAEQKRESRTQVIPIAPVFLSNRYDANSIKKLLCTDESGDTLWVYPNKDTQLEFTTRSGDVVNMYFDTVFLEGSKLKGLRSRLLNLQREVDLSDVVKIEVYTELSKTEPIRPK